MAAPAFGFSVGDFITGVQLLASVISAVRSSSRAPAEYEATLLELEHISHLLSRAKSLCRQMVDPEEAQRLRSCAVLCNTEIRDFTTRLAKREPALLPSAQGRYPESNQVRTIVAKVEWVVTLKDEVATLKAAILPQLQVVGLYLQFEVLERVLDMHRLLVSKVQDPRTLHIPSNTIGSGPRPEPADEIVRDRSPGEVAVDTFLTLPWVDRVSTQDISGTSTQLMLVHRDLCESETNETIIARRYRHVRDLWCGLQKLSRSEFTIWSIDPGYIIPVLELYGRLVTKLRS